MTYEAFLEAYRQLGTMRDARIQTGISKPKAARYYQTAKSCGDITAVTGRERLRRLITTSVIKKGQIQHVLDQLTDDECNYLLSKMGKSDKLSDAITGIIHEAARNSRNGNTGGDKG